MPDPTIIVSPLSRVVEEDGQSVEVAIYRLENTEWSLEIVAGDGCSTMWDDLFASDEAALADALSAIKDEGVKSFLQAEAAKDIIH